MVGVVCPYKLLQFIGRCAIPADQTPFALKIISLMPNYMQLIAGSGKVCAEFDLMTAVFSCVLHYLF
jgi:hypothetical protein